jgi:DNA-binding NarL/FixJ family response regulator
MPTRILIVEDNPVARSFLTRVVRESFSDPIDIVECASLGSARQALVGTAASSAPADFRLVLCALELVDGPGLELLEQLRHYPAIRIATTLYSDDEHLFPALQFGAAGYLIKEDRFEVQVEELQRIVRGQPSLSPSVARKVVGFLRSGSGAAHGASDAARAAVLSTRETELLGHLCKGFTLKEISRVTGLRPQLIHEHILSIYHKLEAASQDVVVATESEDLDG